MFSDRREILSKLNPFQFSSPDGSTYEQCMKNTALSISLSRARHRRDRTEMLRRLLLIVLALASLEDVSGQKVDLRAACDAAECSGQNLIERFTGDGKLIFLSGDASCHIVDIQVKPNVSLRYEIYGDKNYTSRFEDGCFRPVHSTVLKELFLPVQSCSDMLINLECRAYTEDIFLITKQNPGDCLSAGLGEVEERFGYRVEVRTLDQCGEQERGVWHSVVSWVKGAWKTVKGWF